MLRENVGEGVAHAECVTDGEGDELTVGVTEAVVELDSVKDAVKLLEKHALGL